MKLSVLDQSVALAGKADDEAIRDTLALAEHCEALGYERFWVSEHHSLATIVGSAPEVLLAAVAARTRRIRIGSAGVMLPHYAAFKVAEQFRVLDALAPGRVDLGLGRAPGGDMRTARALNPHADPENFPQQVQELQAWLAGQPWRGVTAHPRGPLRPGASAGSAPIETARVPDVWILGSSNYGAQLAAQLGLPYAYAYFFMDGAGVEQALDIYRRLYQPSERHPVPQATICVWALAADTTEQACRLATSRERWRIDRNRGVFGPLQSPEQVAAQGYTADEQAVVDAVRAKALVGTAAEVGAAMRRLATELQLDELVVNTWAHDRAARRQSYTLLAQEFGLLR
ncbi:MAG: LLM class flavin-dependent oxidoreductase [Burkholderiales bacterium]|nr:LLM class flavin-dependent oxidoreductase [Burkholderiales bacterium]